MNVANDPIGDHGPVTSVEDVFAFGNPQAKADAEPPPKVEPAAKSVQIIPSAAKPVVKGQIRFRKARPVVTVQSHSRRAVPVANDAQPTSQKPQPAVRTAV